MPDGQYTLEVIAGDLAENWSSMQAPYGKIWETDTVAPTAVLNDLPPLMTSLQAVDITVTGTGVVSYQWRHYDGTSWSGWSEFVNRIDDPTITLSGLATAAHTLQVIAADAAGNVQSMSTPTEYIWSVDPNVPTAEYVEITKPALKSNTDAIDVRVAANGSNGVSLVYYQYKLDSGAWSADKDPATDHIIETDLDDGPHTLYIRGRGATAGSWQSTLNPTEYSWTIDTVAPVAEFVSTPPAYTSNQSALFAITAVDGYSYKYALYSDLNPVISYGSEELFTGNSVTGNISLSSLAGDTYKLYVLAKDEAGNWQSSPTIYTWQVITNVPRAVLSGAPGEITNVDSIDITVNGVDAYKYKLDTGLWSGEIDHLSHIQLSGLSAGSHDIYVIGKNLAGIWQAEGDPTYCHWIIDNTPPSASDLTLSNLPSDPTAETTASIIAGGSGLIQIKYKLDGAAWSSAVDLNETTHQATISLSGITNGSHTIYVVASDGAGNWIDYSDSKSYSWRVDTLNPLATLSNYPENPNNSGVIDITVGGTGIELYKYRINGGSWSTWAVRTDHIIYDTANGSKDGNTLSDDTYTIEVCGSKDTTIPPDTAVVYTQQDGEATTYTWKVDTVAPAVVFDSITDNGTTCTVDVGGTDVIAYRYRLDYDPDLNPVDWRPSAGDRGVGYDILLSGLSYGNHILEVTGRDDAGNWSVVKTRTWNIVAPELISPTVADNAVSTSSSIVFTWQRPAGTADVMIQISTDSTFSSGGTSIGGQYGLPIGNVNTYSFTPSLLPENALDDFYYARVSVNAESGKAANDPSWVAWGQTSDGVKITGTLAGKVVSPISGVVTNATVDVYDTFKSASIAVLTTDANGGFSLGSVPIGTNRYRLDISKTDFNGSQKNNVTIARGQNTDVGILSILETSASPGYTDGSVIDANDGTSISGAVVELIDSNGDPATSSVLSSPTFRLPSSGTVPAGIYSIKITYSGYFDFIKDGLVINGYKLADRQAICKILVEPQVRAILLWGSTPGDIDMHLVGPTSKNVTSDGAPNNKFHIYYDMKSFFELDGQYADSGSSTPGDKSGNHSTSSLVLDDVDSYGPEAINLFRYGGAQYSKGIFTYTVHNYSNSYVSGGSWSTEPITMRVYDSGGMVREINFPSSPPANQRCWKAIKINIQGNSRNSRTITLVNQFGTFSLSSKSAMDW